LFNLWNAALATGDSRIVASRYTKVKLFANDTCYKCIILQMSSLVLTLHYACMICQ
jgi:hypothetical protein